MDTYIYMNRTRWLRSRPPTSSTASSAATKTSSSRHAPHTLNPELNPKLKFNCIQRGNYNFLEQVYLNPKS